MSYTEGTLESSQVCLNLNINDFLVSDFLNQPPCHVLEQSQLNPIDPVWVRCILCNMYMQVDPCQLPSDLTLDAIQEITCLKCTENLTLSEEVRKLQNTVQEQCQRIQKLREIKELEGELDVTIDNITNGVASLEITDSNVSSDQEIRAGIPKTSTVTPVYTIPTMSENIEGRTPLVQEEDTLPIAHTPLTVEGAPLNHIKPVQQLLGCDNVKTMLLGDCSFQYADVNGVQSCQENEFFRVARAESKLDELVETADFLLDNLYENVTRVVFHVGMNDLKAGNTELLKEKIDNIIIKMAKRNIVPVISGPIPFFGMPGELFSRLCCINDWLIKMSIEKHVLFINNFASFWGRRHLFVRGMLLSNAGNRRLVNNISTYLSTVAPIQINPAQ